ncbi:hypothetical protein Pcinc_018637 [Petrolisthes cinctipes]|uniref:Dipeptidase n=1 Tax=Petrolisthes cinctipes TaxID=88211 RepID=A0AAE1KMI9_PETCI|nr:hypothetical protein Pcinc_027680 [Petrolisthes cinctipes]KAK3876592.1 hypothetical protein Pcinc_018637 [Petrolisthes cinctipes]
MNRLGLMVDLSHVSQETMRLPDGLKDVSGYPRLFAELLGDVTWSLQDLAKLAGLNLLRVMRHVEKVREQLREEKVLPYEEEVPLTAGDHEACFYRFLRPPDGDE